MFRVRAVPARRENHEYCNGRGRRKHGAISAIIPIHNEPNLTTQWPLAQVSQIVPQPSKK